jgi:hypothetical protein
MSHVYTQLTDAEWHIVTLEIGLTVLFSCLQYFAIIILLAITKSSRMAL